ncbi:DUF4232 domain-containing protein [Streptomyces sp. B15]|uniref:DUF4232 domain-containing protein n=1 Tax=Streptomyces sp. B15 TaxID=1537797 RepID=UPI00160F9E82|nr:DUF4232 domain-containing protein [Streptomyces sp. B15]MBQ1124827.1 DUF4232 domain-containing protein [Streptomyces sp. B15]
MARDADLTHATTVAGQRDRETTGEGPGPYARSGCRVRRPARPAAVAVMLLTAGVLLAGCGEKDSAASKPRRVDGDAAPAGVTPPEKQKGSSGSKSDHGDEKKKSKGGAASSSEAASGGSGRPAGSAGTSGGSGGSGDSGDTGGNGTQPGSGAPGSACTASELNASIGPNRPGAGQNHYALVFTNSSGRTCTVHGFPGFAFINAAGDQVSVPPEREGSSSQVVELSSGASAWAPLSYANPEMTGTRTVTPDAALLTPPDQRAPLRVDWSGGPVTATGEASVPTIGPLSPGTGS